MWKANKKGIILLLVGLALLAAAHYLLTPYSEALADQVLALGFCLLLFGVALTSWLSVEKPWETTDHEHGDTDGDGGDDGGSD